MSYLSNKIAELRKSKKYTQLLMATKLDVPQKRYAAWEEGRSEPPSEMLVAIVDIHKITLDELLRPQYKELQAVEVMEEVLSDSDI